MVIAPRKFTALVSVFAVATACASFSPTAKAQSPRKLVADPAIARLQADIPALMKEAEVPGMSVAVIRGGKVFWQGNFGVKNTKAPETVGDSAVFEAASLSKPVFAYAVLKLVEQ